MRPSYMAPCHVTGRISIGVIHGLDRRIARSSFGIQSDREELNYEEQGGTDRGYPLGCTQVRPPARPQPTSTPPSWRPPSCSCAVAPTSVVRPLQRPLPRTALASVKSAASSSAGSGHGVRGLRCGTASACLIFEYHSGVLCATEQSCAFRSPPMRYLFRGSVLSKWI